MAAILSRPQCGNKHQDMWLTTLAGLAADVMESKLHKESPASAGDGAGIVTLTSSALFFLGRPGPRPEGFCKENDFINRLDQIFWCIKMFLWRAQDFRCLEPGSISNKAYSEIWQMAEQNMPSNLNNWENLNMDLTSSRLTRSYNKMSHVILKQHLTVVKCAKLL